MICSCEKSPLSQSIFDDLTPEEVLSIQEEVPSFRFFYDRIRTPILSNCDEYDKVQYKKVTYKSMYDLFNYWGSEELWGIAKDYVSSYDEQMSKFQSQIDTISESYRSLIDKYKVAGVPEFDFAKIFKHPELHYVNYYSGLVLATFELPIKDHNLFDDINFKSLEFKVTLFYNDEGDEIHLATRANDVTRFKMKSSNSSTGETRWKLWDNPAAENGGLEYAYQRFSDSYSSLKVADYPTLNTFQKDYDWYYEVESSSPSFNSFVKDKVPEVVYNYWMGQEGSNIDSYINARTRMILEYCDSEFMPLSRYLPSAIEENIVENYPKESYLYQKAVMNNERVTTEFESMFEKIEIGNGDWGTTNIELPISNPNGNYVLSSEYEGRIVRESSKKTVFPALDEKQRRPGESYASYVQRLSTSGFGLK